MNIWMTMRHLLEVLIPYAPLRHVVSGSMRALAFGVVFFVMIYLLERASGGQTDQYRTRGFLQDVAYWFYYQSGLNQLILMAALFSLLTPRLAFLQLRMLTGLPLMARVIIWFLAVDFCSYWIHRLQHASRFVWAFHSTHHAQEQLNFATTTRFHPVDHFVFDMLNFVPVLMLGASPLDWLPFILVSKCLALAQHSRIKWRLGPLSAIIVTPRFHSFHHSADARHYNKNFGAYLTIWDRIFGTAMDAPEQPAAYGLADIKMPTLLSTLVVPFRLLRQFYFQPSLQEPPDTRDVAQL
jgi:sterol desaturase/sphingolipid hydroxylase (fatty acid hydroxylase superfamily)